jgi:uncharacterized repeat protein (TIGR02543 family)
LPTAERVGYDFDGWNTQSDGNGTSYSDADIYRTANNATFYAQWTGIFYTLSFDANEGDVSPASQPVQYGSPIVELPVPTRDGYGFDGWHANKDGSGTTYTTGMKYEEEHDVTVYARWIINKCTVTFNMNYPTGVVPPPKHADYGSSIILPSSVTRTGYNFEGWNTAANGSGANYAPNADYTVTGNVTFYAQWTANEYSLSFETNGGSSVNDKQVKYGEAIGALPVSNRTGYTFKGWFNGSVRYTEVTVYLTEGNTTLSAQWETNTYTLSFDANYPDAISLSDRQITYGSIIGTLPALSSRTAYTFAGWNTRRNGEGLTYTENSTYLEPGDITLYAQWTAKEYYIIFDSQGGTSVDNLKATYNSPIGTLAVPVRAGYTFDGWFTEANEKYTDITVYNNTNNITLYAKWTAGTYTLTFDAQGGSSANSQQVTYGAIINVLPETVRLGYTFEGWFTEANGDGAKYTKETVYSVTDNTTLYAKWTLKRHTISFDAQGGNTVSAIQTDYDATVSLTDATRTGYTFKGWNTKSDGTGISYIGSIHYTADSDISLYAQWEANTYTLNFDVQGGNPINNQSVTYNHAVGILPNLTRTGYTFDGWFTGTNGGGIQYSETTVYTVADNTTLYAQWTARKYLLGFNVNYAGADSELTIKDVTYGSTAGGGESLPVPKRPGYTFTEWNTEIDGSGITYISATVYTVTGNTTLYAQWTPNLYTLSFEANYIGEVTKPENPASHNIVYGSAVGTLPTLTHAGYIFMGWNTAENGSGETYTETTVYAVAGNTTLYAHWTGISYTVNFVGSNVELDPQPVTHGAKIVRPSDPTLQGYAFAGWYKDNDLWDFNTPVTGDILLTAKWISGDTELKSLTINAGKLSPEFRPSITDYAVMVSYDVATVTITGMPHNSASTVTGNVEDMALKLGDNYVKIIVTAEDGINTRIYTVLITRADHILSNEANLIYLTANEHQVTITGNTLEYVAACGETSFALELQGSQYASIAVDGLPYTPGQIIPLTGDVTTIKIHITSETGNAVNNYILKANAAIDENRLYYLRWPDVFGINANPDNNGGYEVTSVRWFRRDGSPAGNKGYIQLQNSASNYYAEIQTLQTEGWRRVCGVPITRGLEKIVAYPNPLPQGESLKLELPEQYVGGMLNIYNIQGALIKSDIHLPVKSNSINVSDLSSGIYLFNISKDNNRDVIKIIVE